MSTKLPVVTYEEAIRVFTKVGYVRMSGRGKGSHIVMGRRGDPVQLTIPSHRELKRGTLRALIRDAGITVEVFTRLHQDR
jgi:predicted RNA binding protein YcfA (HicA-like mRNA interferase family)